METDIVVAKDTGLANEEWYRSLVEDCQAIKVERGFNANLELIQGKWEVGKRISEENDNMERANVYGKRIIENLAGDLGTSTSNLWQCTQFYKQFEVENFEEVLNRLPEGKDISWFKITQKYLGERQVKEKKPKQSYKLVDVLEVMRRWMYEDLDMRDMKIIDEKISLFRENLIGYKEVDKKE